MVKRFQSRAVYTESVRDTGSRGGGLRLLLALHATENTTYEL